MGPGFGRPEPRLHRFPVQPSRDFSVLRARKRELLDEQRSCWAEGRPLQPEELMGRWPTNPDSDPDAASLLLEDYLQRRAGRRDQPGGIRATLSRAEAGARRAPRARNRLPLDWGRERRPGVRPPLARRGGRGLRLPPAPGPRAGGVRPGVPGGAGRPGRPPCRTEGHGHRRGRAPDARAVAAHQHRPDLFAPRGSARGLACRLHALPGRGKPFGRSDEALDRIVATGLRQATGARPGVGRGPEALDVQEKNEN